jgi:DNA-3-methyladenine glycosylase
MPEGPVAVRLVEVEAYRGADDPASHSFRGRTPRNAGDVRPGRAPLRLLRLRHALLRQHHLHARRRAGGVLLRAGEVVSDLGMARARRPTARRDADLARGPPGWRRCWGWAGAQRGRRHRSGVPVRLLAAPPVDPALVRTGPRVGVAAGHDTPWRFWLADSPAVSPFRPGRRRVTPAVGGAG